MNFQKSNNSKKKNLKKDPIRGWNNHQSYEERSLFFSIFQRRGII